MLSCIALGFLPSASKESLKHAGDLPDLDVDPAAEGPAVEAGERLGFLPGDMVEKVNPYLRPLYDALYEMLGFEYVAKLIERQVIEVAPLALVGNVFGWTVDEPTSFRLLDAFVDAGFNLIDTADSYSRWVTGHQGGESETIIGNWLARNPSRRDQVHILTKVGSGMPATNGRKTRRISDRFSTGSFATCLGAVSQVGTDRRDGIAPPCSSRQVRPR